MPVGRALLYVASIAAVALCVRALAIGPPSLPFALGVLGGYVGLVTVGVLFMRLGMFLEVTTRGPGGARGVALTFDDGPHPEHTRRVLDSLDAFGAKAAFFVIGRKADAHPELVREIARRGHALGVHGYSHDRFFSLRSRRRVRRDLRRAVAALERITGERPRLFRPPIGHLSPAIAGVARELGLRAVGWSVRGLDGWRGARARRVAARVRAGLRDGAIVLLHDAAECDDRVPAGVEALDAILATAARNGLRFVRVDHWLRA